MGALRPQMSHACPVRAGAAFCECRRDKNGDCLPRSARWRGHSRRCAAIRSPARVAGRASAQEGPGDARSGPAPHGARRCVALGAVTAWTRAQGRATPRGRGLSHCLRVHLRLCELLCEVPGSFTVHGPGGPGASHHDAPVRGLARAGRISRSRTGPLAVVQRTCSRCGSAVRTAGTPVRRTGGLA